MLSVEELNDRLIDLAFAEDIGDGDHTTLCCIPADAMGESKLLIKEEGVFAGVDIAKEVFRRFDPTMEVEVYIQDGTHVKPGDIVMSVKGKIQSLLQTERLMLNILQRMSGIATMTAKYVKRLEGTKTRVLDTRKTTPGMRMLEKQAVKIGGGTNHDFAELQRVLDFGGVDRIMLDNFTPAETKKAVDMIAGRFETESSGGITFDTIRDYAEQGVDFISVGALTHSVKGLDMSFKAADSDKLKIKG